MSRIDAVQLRSTFRDAAVLATRHLQASAAPWPAWGDAEARAVRGTAARLLTRQAECARVVGPAAPRLVGGISLVPYLGPAGGLGPAWPAHPLASPGWYDARPLREPDATRALAAFMGPMAGPRGAERARSFLQVVVELAGADAIHEALAQARRPTVTAEHLVRRAGRPSRAPLTASRRAAAPRIDLLFEWPLGDAGRRAVVVVEAKLGATVAHQQLRPYREEARRRAGGGPVALILLTARADAAEVRHRAWQPVRWFALLRRWEVVLAAAGDTDPEFARLRANLWRYVLKTEKACQ